MSEVVQPVGYNWAPSPGQWLAAQPMGDSSTVGERLGLPRVLCGGHITLGVDTSRQRDSIPEGPEVF